MSFEFIQPDGMPAPSGYSYAVSATGQRLFFVAGQTAQDANGRIVGPNDLVRQFEIAIQNIVKVLKAGGAGADNVTKMTIFVTDVSAYREHLRPIGSIYRKYFGKHYPAMTLVEIRKLFDPEAMIEIEVIAVVP